MARQPLHLLAGLLLMLLASASALGLKAPRRCLNQQRRRGVVGRVLMSGEDEQPGLLKSVVVGGILLGVFGTSLGSVRDVVSDVVAPPPPTKVVKKGESGERGALTRLTRREIASKLAQVPVFFGTPSGGGGISGGKIFISLKDAQEFVKESGGSQKLGAATLEDVYYPLVLKKAKIIPGMGVASMSDPAAEYSLLAPSSQSKETADLEGLVLGKDVPLFRVANLAFQRNGIEIPLFLFKSDALSTFERLEQQEVATSKSSLGSTPPPVQVTSIGRIVALWESGGMEGRALEIYPGDLEVQEGRRLLGAEME